MSRFAWLRMACVAASCFLFAAAASLQAAIAPTGDVTPSLPWNSSTSGYVGKQSDGALAVDGGSALSSRYVDIGCGNGVRGEVTVTGGGSTLTNAFVLYVGDRGSGTLSITRGASVSGGCGFIGKEPGSTGTATVDGAGSTWTSDLVVGEYGSGALSVTGGASVSSSCGYIGDYSGSIGVVTVDGDGSTWVDPSGLARLYVGEYGSGRLSITGGAYVSFKYGTIGDYPGSTGAVTVDGAGSSWANFYDTSGLLVGGHGSGRLSITGGAYVDFKYVTIGDSPGSTGAVTVDGAGSTWVSSDIKVGAFGSGTVSITGGAKVSTPYAAISYYSGSTGAVTVDGADSAWVNTCLYVGYLGTGRLTITGGGSVNSNYGYIGNSSGSSGAVTVDGAGSVWTTFSCLDVGEYGSGTLSITGGAKVSSPHATIGQWAGSTGVVTVDGAGTIWDVSGGLSVGSSGKGTLNISSGASVIVAGSTIIASYRGSAGAIHFGNGGAILTTQSLFGSPTQLNGIGTINARGLVSDLDLVFDSTASLRQAILFAQPGQNVTLNLDLSSTPSSNGALGAGYLGAGCLRISNGVTVTSDSGCIGYRESSRGTVTVDGAGTTWTNSGLYVGRYGSGTLSVTGGARVSSMSVYIGANRGSAGGVRVDGTGTTWTNSGLYVGDYGSGTLSVTGGAKASSTSATIGYGSGSSGAVTVDGAGSAWTNFSDLLVGDGGNGILSITGGGVVSSKNGVVGGHSGGAVAVDGAGSAWSNSSSLAVGDFDTGTLSITGGGVVNAADSFIRSRSLLAIDVGNGSQFTIQSGLGQMSNNGRVQILAGAGPAAGSKFSPIAAGIWSGTGSYQALGGMWDTGRHELTVSAVASGTSGTPLPLDLAQTQRALVGDTEHGWSVGASLLAKTGSATQVDFTATAVGGDALTALETKGGPGQAIVGAWQFSAVGNGYASADPIYLSFDVGAGRWRSDLHLWDYDGTSWTAFDASDLTYNQPYASFTTTALHGYAVSVLNPAFARWTGNGGRARWDVAANWLDGAVPADADVGFGVTFTNGDTIDLGGARSAHVMTFTNTASQNLTFTNGALSLTGISKTVGSGSVTFAETTAVNVAGGATIDQGTLAIAGTMVAGSIRGTGSVRIDGAGRAAIRATPVPNTSTSTSHVASLSIAGGATPTGTLDLNSNSLIIDYTLGAGLILSDVTAQIRSGRNGKDANDQAKWNGPGIITTAGRAANVAAKVELYNLGAINNADLDVAGIGRSRTSFAGQPVTPDTVLVMYTYSGDTNLDGVVDADDYSYWLNGFLGTTNPSVQGWLRGDFDYNGVSDGDDYTQWLNTFLHAGPPLSGSDPAPVPEPATVLLLAVSALCLRRRVPRR